MRLPIFMALLLLGTSLVLGLEMPSPYDAHVNDFAHFFSGEELAALHVILDPIERSTAEIVIVTLNSTYPQTPAAFRTELFNQWGIGEKEHDNGLLILYAVQEHRIEVETGYGLEGVLPDSKIGRLLDEFYVPLRDQHNTSAGIIAFTQQIANILETNNNDIGSQQQSSVLSPFILDMIILLVLVAWFIFSHIRSRKNAHRCSKDGLKMKYMGLVGGYVLYRCMKGHEEKILEEVSRRTFFGGFGGGGFSGGGGFGGFGGGSSGGGGVGR